MATLQSTSLDPIAPPHPAVRAMLQAARAVPNFGTDVDATLGWCVGVAEDAPDVAGGRTGHVWEILAATAAYDVSAARMLEPHLDALSILRQTREGGDGHTNEILASVHADAQSTWGVFAAEAVDMRLEARVDSRGWTLTGTKPWCSLAAHLTHALVTASVDGGQRRLFAVSLRQPGVHPHTGPWVARGLADIVSAPVDFGEVPAVPVGNVGWYLTRLGFAWGGMSVAACWWGAAVGVVDSLRAAAQSERADQLALVHLGRADAALWAARATLAEAATLVDARTSAAIGERLLAERVRGIVADAATLTLAEADAALGPAPLVTDAAHARRVSDLHVYLRQHHGLRDSARIGRELVSAAAA